MKSDVKSQQIYIYIYNIKKYIKLYLIIFNRRVHKNITLKKIRSLILLN